MTRNKKSIAIILLMLLSFSSQAFAIGERMSTGEQKGYIRPYKPSTYKPSTYKPSTYKPSTYKPSTYKPSTYKPPTPPWEVGRSKTELVLGSNFPFSRAGEPAESSRYAAEKLDELKRSIDHIKNGNLTRVAGFNPSTTTVRLRSHGGNLVAEVDLASAIPYPTLSKLLYLDISLKSLEALQADRSWEIRNVFELKEFSSHLVNDPKSTSIRDIYQSPLLERTADKSLRDRLLVKRTIADASDTLLPVELSSSNWKGSFLIDFQTYARFKAKGYFNGLENLIIEGNDKKPRETKVLRLVNQDIRVSKSSPSKLEAVGGANKDLTRLGIKYIVYDRSLSTAKLEGNTLLVPRRSNAAIDCLLDVVGRFSNSDLVSFRQGIENATNLTSQSISRISEQISRDISRQDVEVRINYHEEVELLIDGQKMEQDEQYMLKTFNVSVAGLSPLVELKARAAAMALNEGLPDHKRMRFIFDTGVSGSIQRGNNLSAFGKIKIVVDKRSLDEVATVGSNAASILEGMTIGSTKRSVEVELMHYNEGESGLSRLESKIDNSPGIGEGKHLIITICPKNPIRLIQLRNKAIEKGKYESVTFPLFVDGEISSKQKHGALDIPIATMAIMSLRKRPNLLETGGPSDVVRSAFKNLERVFQRLLESPLESRISILESELDVRERESLEPFFLNGLSDRAIRRILKRLLREMKMFMGPSVQVAPKAIVKKLVA